MIIEKNKPRMYKTKNLQTIGLLQHVEYVYKAENTSLVRKLNYIVENA